MSNNNNNNIVFDIGSLNSKIGFGEDDPILVPSVVGKLKYNWCGMIGDKNMPPNYFIGDDALFNKRYKLVNKRTVEGEKIVDWDDYERLLSYCFKKILGKEQDDGNNVLLIESPFNSKYNREKITQMMFETFNVNSFYILSQPELSLHSINKKTGLIVQCGHLSSYIVPIVNGIIIKDAISTFKISGKQIDKYLLKLLTSRSGCDIGSIIINKGNDEIIESIIQNIKETLCFISLNFENEIKKYGNETKEYCLSSDEFISIKKDILIKCTEILFNPSIDPEIDSETVGIANIIYSSIMKCNENDRNELISNIITTGGTTLFKGFNERLKNELLLLLPSSYSISITPTTINSSFIGGTMLSNNPLLKSKWITKEIYDENGPEIIIKNKENENILNEINK